MKNNKLETITNLFEISPVAIPLTLDSGLRLNLIGKKNKQMFLKIIYIKFFL